MSTVEEIKTAIEHLTLSERAQLEKWLHGWRDDEWDRHVMADSAGGKLDALLKEVDEEIDRDDLRDLP